MDVRYLHLPAGQIPPDWEGPAPFKAVVVIEQDVSDEWRELVSDWLVRRGCLYMMAWGQDCSLWDDSVDLATLARFDYGDIPEDDFVMTTWHENEPLSEVLWYAAHVANHPTRDIGPTVILHVSAHPREAELLRASAAAHQTTTGA